MDMDIAAEKYVSITTVRRSGAVVPSPVWIAPFGPGRACFTTDGDSGKVKRLRNNNVVTLQRCTMRGAVDTGSPIIEATAIVVDGDEYAAVHRAIRAKYGLMVTLIGIPTAIKKLFGKRDTGVGIVITLPGATSAGTDS